MPCLTMNQNNNDEWIKNTDYSNISKEKSKIKRPNSCKPNIIVINREIQDNSKVFNSDYLFNNSNKRHKSKPASGKTRTNGSYSTNILTSP